MSHFSVLTIANSMLCSKDISLRQSCRYININNSDDLAIAQLTIAEIFKTIFSLSNGSGLAAPQIGIQLRIVVINYNKPAPRGKERIILINPEITSFSEAIEEENETCFSIPNLTGKVARSKNVEVKAYDHRGSPLNFTASDFLARVIQHEVDHLNGILFIDRANELQNIADYPERAMKATLKQLGLDNINIHL